jgi:hypothetical protein
VRLDNCEVKLAECKTWQDAKDGEAAAAIELAKQEEIARVEAEAAAAQAAALEAETKAKEKAAAKAKKSWL